MNEELPSQVIGTIAQAKGLDPATITVATPLATLALDSLDRVSLSFDLEENYAIVLSEQQFAHVQTVGDVVTLVSEAVQAKAEQANSSAGPA